MRRKIHPETFESSTSTASTASCESSEKLSEDHCHRSGLDSDPLPGGCPTPPCLAPKLPRRLRSLFGSASIPKTEAQPSEGWLLPAPTAPEQQTRLKGPRLGAAKAKIGQLRLLRRRPASGCGDVQAIATSHAEAKPASQELQEGLDAVEFTAGLNASEAPSAEAEEAPTMTSFEAQPSTVPTVQHTSGQSSVLDGVDPEAAALLGVQIGPCTLKGVLCHGRLGPLYYTTRSACGLREVVKVLEKSRVSHGQGLEVSNELRFVRKLRHPNVAEILGAIHAPQHVFIRMTFGGQRNLCHIMQGRRPTAQQVCRIEAQLASALAYCHAQGVAHRDVSPANIAVSNDGKQIKLVGFGSTVPLGEECSDVAGTMPFLAPEVMEAAGPGAVAPYEPAGADVWSCGVVLLALLGGAGRMAAALGWGQRFANGASMEPSAARACELRELFAHSGAAAHVFGGVAAAAQGRGCGEELLEVFARTLDVEPQRRWTAAELAESAWLRHGQVPMAA